MRKFWVESEMGIHHNISCHHTPSIVAKTTFLYIQDIGHFWSGPTYSTKREGYKSILMLYTASGSGRAYYRGNEYVLQPGSVMLMDCYDYQEYATLSQEIWELKWIHFWGGTCLEYYKLIYEKCGPLLLLEENSAIPAIHDELMKVTAQSSLAAEATVSMLLMQLLTELFLSGAKGSDLQTEKPVADQIHNALTYVENNYACDITLSGMANAACCSIYHFSRLFKAATGFSPYEYIIKFRLNQAKSLLKDSEHPVSAISQLVGFASDSNFIRTFREVEGMTPLSYRKYWR